MNINHHTEREVRRTLKLLREVWLNIKLEPSDLFTTWSIKMSLTLALLLDVDGDFKVTGDLCL